MNIYVVLGVHYAGKSTLIRHITGYFKKGLTSLTRSNGTTRRAVFVIPKSPKESKWTPAEIQQFLQEDLAIKKSEDLVIAIRQTARSNDPMGHQHYLNMLAGFGTLHIVNLVEDAAGAAGVPSASVVIWKDPITSNEVAAQVRSIWGWL